MECIGMIEAEWWEYDTSDEMADAVAGDVGFIIESALDARNDCLLALPGGKSPIPIFERLKDAKINWKRVTIVPGDDRLVELDNPLSNVALLARHFMPLGARVVPILSANLGYRQAGDAAEARLKDLKWPPDLVWLGMGTDGHTASIFPGPRDRHHARSAAAGSACRARDSHPLGDPVGAHDPADRLG
jgi:6-phosphogluconolactonase